MTTKVTIEANHGGPVRVTYIDPCEGRETGVDPAPAV